MNGSDNQIISLMYNYRAYQMVMIKCYFSSNFLLSMFEPLGFLSSCFGPFVRGNLIGSKLDQELKPDLYQPWN